MTWKVTAEESEGSGAENGQGGAAAGGGTTSDTTSEDTDTSGPGGRYWAGRRKWERVTSRQEKPDGKSSGVGEGEGIPKAPGVAENTRGIAREWGWGEVELLRGIDKPGVEELPRGEKTSGLTLKGNKVPEMHGWGRGWNRSSSATRDTEGSAATSHREEMAIGQDPVAPLSARQGPAEVGRVGSTQINSDGTDSARPEHSALVCRDYGLLEPEEQACDPAAAGAQGSREDPRDTTGIGETNWMETVKGERNRHRVCHPCAARQRKRWYPPPNVSARLTQQPSGGGDPNQQRGPPTHR